MHATDGHHDTLYQLVMRHDVNVLFSDRHRALSDTFVSLHLFEGWQYVDVSEASPAAWADELTVAGSRIGRLSNRKVRV